MMKDFLLVGLGGGIGSMIRYGSNVAIGNKPFPLATLLINIVGSLLIGAVIGLSIKNETFSNNWKLFLATGICGGFTTFSAFSLENMGLLQSGRIGIALTYIIISVVAAVIASFLGYQLIIKS